MVVWEAAAGRSQSAKCRFDMGRERSPYRPSNVVSLTYMPQRELGGIHRCPERLFSPIATAASF